MRALLVLLFMAVSIQWGFAQLNLNVSRGTLGTVIEQIKSQSKYQFFYDDKLAALPVEKRQSEQCVYRRCFECYSQRERHFL